MIACSSALRTFRNIAGFCAVASSQQEFSRLLRPCIKGTRRFFSSPGHMEVVEGEADKTMIREGKAVLAAGVATDKVFYNPVQEFNRDLSCLVLSAFLDRFKIRLEEKQAKKQARRAENGNPNSEFPPFRARVLDAMAATGLRSCRYALQSPLVAEVVANDSDETACQAIRLNAEANNCADKVIVTHQDARRLMINSGFDEQWFHAVDLDPFGSASPFVEGALQCVADGGLLMATCTDTAILCGNFAEACYARYGATAVRNPAHHEISLRIVLYYLANRAMHHNKNIEPLISVREGHYVRVFLAVHRGAQEAKQVVMKASYMKNCTVCHNIQLQPICEPHKTAFYNASLSGGSTCDICGTVMKIGGPIWNANIHDNAFVTILLSNLDKDSSQYGTKDLLRGKLTMIQEELPDQPFYIQSKDIFKVVHCLPIPSRNFFSALHHAGYKYSPTHCELDSIKTNAPFDVVWDIIRCWVKQNPIAENRRSEPKIARILGPEPKIQANFTLHPDADFGSRKNKMLRFPTAGVKGPMARPKRLPWERSPPSTEDDTDAEVKKAKLDGNNGA
ncbi:hypothetical protein RvY_02021 [Ramazzottius varieornatus]|uniref:tRNA (guanine(26)-N(2))-dimethyltransferase n=1 Tax=Ramazzottius varieornatus TaxID=947166 RepID=A0A1D1USX9_RAMVA|nr:hypothetical protein RvY_02021 [Ramazzottius varieornatus]